MENNIPAKRPKKQATVPIRISVKDYAYRFQAKIRRDKGSHYILIKKTIHQEDVMMINTYTSSVVAANFMKQTCLGIKGQIGLEKITVSAFCTYSYQ
jgi:hypothetical protein